MDEAVFGRSLTSRAAVAVAVSSDAASMIASGLLVALTDSGLGEIERGRD